MTGGEAAFSLVVFTVYMVALAIWTWRLKR